MVRERLAFKHRISLFFTNNWLFLTLFSKFKKFLTKDLFGYFITFLLLLNSGHAYFTFNIGSKFEQAITLALLIISLTIYILARLDFVLFLDKFKKKHFSIPSIFLIFIIFSIFWILMSFLLNPQRIYNINNYLSILSVLIISVLYICVFTFEDFFKYFSRIILFFSAIALYFYAFNFFVGESWSTSIHVVPGRNFLVESYFGLFYNFRYASLNNNVVSDRLLSVFWEPGVYGSILIIAQFGELFINKKPRLIFLFVFILSSILTFSTATYLLLGLLYIAYLFKLIKNKKTEVILFIFFAMIVLIGFIYINQIFEILAKLLPKVFSKIVDGDQSFLTRLQSPIYFIQLFLQRPFIGYGGKTAYELYMLTVPSHIDAGTSTYGYVLASFGLFGIIYILLPIISILFSKRFSIPVKILLLLLFIGLSNKENQIEIMFINIFLFFFISEAFIRNKKIEEHPYNGNNIFKILFNKDGKYVGLRDVVFSLVARISTMIIAIAIIPIYSNFFNDDGVFGVWLIVLSVVTWILNLDLGFGHGLKNKLIEHKDEHEQKVLISSTYVATSVISMAIFIIFSIVFLFLDLNKLFGDVNNNVPRHILLISLIIITFSSSIELILKNVNAIIQSKQKNWITNLIGLISNIIVISIVLSINVSTSQKILFVAIAYSISIVVPYLFTNIYYFYFNSPNLRPSIKMFDKKALRLVMNFGLIFFLIQIGNLLLFASDTIIAGRMFGSESVVEYDKYTKFFFALYSMFTAIGFPLWVTTSKYRTAKNYSGLLKTFKTLLLIGAIFSMLSIILSVFMQPIFDIWLGRFTISIKPLTLIIIVFYFSSKFLTGSLIFFNNGLEKLKAQIYVTFIGVILKLPLILLLKVIFPNLGWEVIVLVDALVYIPYIPFGFMEIKKELSLIKEEQS